MANRIKGITVEIGGDTTKLQTALKGVNTQIKSTQSELKDVEKLLKLDPGNTELLAQKHKLLAQAVDETKTKLLTLQTAAEQANTALANGDISQEQYDALQREIIETETDLKKLETQAGSSATALQKIATAGEKLKTTGSTISSVGTKMLPVTAGITALGTAAVTTAANFDTSMSQVQATMGITKDSMSTVNGQSVNTMDTLGELAKKMGSETAFSASECAEALNYLALAGYDTEAMTKTLPTVLNLAAAGNINLADASDMVTDAMSALGLGVDDAETMVDQMAKTASSSNTSVSQLGEGILTIGATAKSIKGGTAELNTALGLLANNGIKGAEGGTHLRNIILSLQNPTDAAAKSLKQLGVDVYDSEGNMRSMNDILGDLNGSMDGMTSEEKSNIIGNIFNKTDLSSVNALLANTGDTWDDLQSSITKSGGAAQDMADTQLDNLSGQITILKSALEGLAISFGELLMPAIKQIVTWIQAFVDKLNSMDDNTKKVIVTIALIIAAIAPVLIVIGKVVSAVGSIMTIVPKLASAFGVVQKAFAALNATMLANPIVLIIAAIAALVAAFIYLWNTNEDFRQFWINLWETVKTTAIAVWNAITTFFTNAWNAIVTTATTLWTSLKTFFSTLWTGIKTIFTTVVTAISTFLTTAWNGIQTAVTTVFTAIKTTIITIFTAIKTFITTVATGIKTAVTTAFTTMWTGITTTIGNIVTTIKSGFNTAVDFIKGLAKSALTWGSDIIDGIVTGIKNCIGKVKDAVSNVAETIKSYLHFSVPDKGPLTDYESWMPDFIGGLASGIDKGRSLVSKEVDKLADTMNLESAIPNMDASMNATVTTQGSTGIGNDTVKLNQPILLDGKTITTLVSQIQYQNGKASLRNLGTA